MSITPSKQTSVYRQVDAILKTEDIYCGDKYIEACVDRSMKKVQGDMITINKMEWGNLGRRLFKILRK